MSAEKNQISNETTLGPDDQVIMLVGLASGGGPCEIHFLVHFDVFDMQNDGLWQDLHLPSPFSEHEVVKHHCFAVELHHSSQNNFG